MRDDSLIEQFPTTTRTGIREHQSARKSGEKEKNNFCKQYSYYPCTGFAQNIFVKIEYNNNMLYIKERLNGMVGAGGDSFALYSRKHLNDSNDDEIIFW